MSNRLYVRALKNARVRDERVRKLTDRMYSTMNWLEASDHPTCRAWAELEILSTLAYSELKTNGLLTAEGHPKKLLEHYRSMRRVQLGFATALGLHPAARKMLSTNGRAPFDLAAALAAPAVPEDEEPSGVDVSGAAPDRDGVFDGDG